MKRKILSLTLTLVMVLSLLPAAAAAERPDATAAQTLHELGLFQGTGIHPDGTPDFDLDRTPTRAEAVTMLVRLLGKEEEAKAGNWTIPFIDVDDWARPYVGYAYTNGLTKGISGDRFGSRELVSANMYTTFILRALGHNDADPDAKYNYTNAAAFAKEIGLTDTSYETGAFVRGDVAKISLCALEQKQNNSEETLLRTLVRTGAVGMTRARRAGFAADKSWVEGETVDIPVTSVEGSFCNVSTRALFAAFPDAYLLTSDIPLTNTYAQEHLELLGDEPQLYASLVVGQDNNVVITDMEEVSLGWNSKSFVAVTQPEELWIQYLLDKDMNVIATRETLEPDGGMKNAVTFRRTYIETDMERVERLKQMVTERAAWAKGNIRIDWDDPQSPWDDGGGMAHIFPVYVDGKAMTDRHYVRSIILYKDALHEPLEDFLWHEEAFFWIYPLVVTLDDGTVFHAVFSEWGREGYGQVWNAQGTLIEAHYGVRYYDKWLTDENIMIFTLVYDENCELLGYEVHNG